MRNQKCDLHTVNHNYSVLLEVLLRLTSDAVDHERVQLFLAVLPLSGEVGDGLHLAVEQVVQQRQGHLLCRATVGADVQHVC